MENLKRGRNKAKRLKKRVLAKKNYKNNKERQSKSKSKPKRSEFNTNDVDVFDKENLDTKKEIARKFEMEMAKHDQVSKEILKSKEIRKESVKSKRDSKRKSKKRKRESLKVKKKEEVFNSTILQEVEDKIQFNEAETKNEVTKQDNQMLKIRNWKIIIDNVKLDNLSSENHDCFIGIRSFYLDNRKK